LPGDLGIAVLVESYELALPYSNILSVLIQNSGCNPFDIIPILPELPSEMAEIPPVPAFS